jgi:hypothetical protein
MAMPAAAKMMWNAREIAICERAARRSVIPELCHVIEDFLPVRIVNVPTQIGTDHLMPRFLSSR